MESSILKMDRKYAVYLPPDYDTSSRDYPVLYLLHGAGDDQTGWIQFGEVLQITDKAIKIGKATPMIIVMPDAQTGQRGYNNSPDGKWRYEDFFFEELIPHVEQQFRIKSTKEFRAVAGLSMGGGGSFIYALHRPDMFSSACPLSAYLGELNYNTYKNRLADNIPDMSEASVKSYYEKYHVLQLIESLPKEKIASVRWYIDCGDDDFLYEGNSLVHIALKKKEIKHEYRVRDGVHNWDYWRTALPEVLAFVSQSFHR
jgi:enterochelin esterase-like enzyme